MKAGQLIHRFSAKDGREVILRTPRWEDLDDLVELMNSIVDEGVDTATTQKITREGYSEQFERRLALMEKGEVVRLVAEVGGK